jgi:hypothetical protein
LALFLVFALDRRPGDSMGEFLVLFWRSRLVILPSTVEGSAKYFLRVQRQVQAHLIRKIIYRWIWHGDLMMLGGILAPPQKSRLT